MIKRHSLHLASILSPIHRLHRRHFCGCFSLMAATTTAASSTSAAAAISLMDSGHKELHIHSGRSNSLWAIGKKINPQKKKLLSAKINGCSGGGSDNSRNYRTDGDSSGSIGMHKPRALAARPLIRDSENGTEERIVQSLNDCGGHSVKYHQGEGGRSLGIPSERPLPEKIVVAVDIDEVLGNFVSALNRFIADRYSLNHSVSEYHVYEFFKIWNCSRDEADIRVHEFFKTSYFTMGIHPIPGAQHALHRLSRFCNLSVVTSRQNAIKDHTIQWIEKHYPGLFQEIHFGNHYALDGQSRPKSDICRSLGAKVLIDDNPRYAIECAEVGIRVLLFDYENSYPWCKSEAINKHPLVTKVYNWEEVEHQLVSWTVS